MQEKKFGLLFLVFIIGAAIGGGSEYYIGRRKGATEVRVEAVRAGHARYVIVDEHGRTAFEWLPALAPPDRK